MQPTTPFRQAAFKSAYGPKYHFQPHFLGFTAKDAIKTGVKTGFFGGVALFTVIFFASGIPRVQNDILKKFPILANLPAYNKEIPASDNPF